MGQLAFEYWVTWLPGGLIHYEHPFGATPYFKRL